MHGYKKKFNPLKAFIHQYYSECHELEFFFARLVKKATVTKTDQENGCRHQ